MVSFLRWGWLLTIALFIPVSLPVGGAQSRFDEILSTYSASYATANNLCELRSVPLSTSKVVRKLSLGTSMEILRTWESPEGSRWLKVKINTLPLIDMRFEPQRGWVQV